MSEKPSYEDLEKRILELERALFERRQEEEELQLMQFSVDNSTDAVYWMGPEAKFIYVNHAAVEALGYSKEELLTMTVHDIGPEFQADVWPLHWTKLKAKKSFVIQTIHQRKDKSTFPVEIALNFIKFGNREINCAIARDITARRMSEEKLQRSEEKHRTLFETMTQGVVYQNEKGWIISANPAAERLLGLTLDQMRGRTSLDPHWRAIHEDGTEFPGETHPSMVALRTGKEVKNVSMGIIDSRTNAYRWINIQAVPQFRPGGDIPFQVYATFEDITEQKRAEEERERLQAQLQKAQKMESIGTLAGGIAHNFNNILMGIQGRASLMMMDKGPSHPEYGHLCGIEECVRNAVELTRDLLGFARGGKYEIKPTDLNRLIKQQNGNFGRTKKEIRFHEKFENKLWPAEVDRVQIQQVLFNLYVNAWQAMPSGGDLYIQTENVTLDETYIKSFGIAPGRYVKISVTDTGTGMDAVTQEKIFDPFFSTRDTGQGSGLGLASVYGIVKNHGGLINVCSVKGEGSTFSIYLPASKKALIEEDPGMEPHALQYGQGTILLVDDEEMIIDVGKKMLESLGYSVLVAQNGRIALDVYGKNGDEIDLVILDMIMPDMGGGETYDRMKAIDAGVRVLLASGYSIFGQAKEIMDRGCQGFIQKPFSLNDLSIKVREIMEK